jgi:hypothetical protein
MAPHKMLELLPGLVACGRSPRLALCNLRVFESGHNAKKRYAKLPGVIL